MRKLAALTALTIALTAAPADAQPKPQQCASRPMKHWRTATVSVWRGWLPESYTFTRREWRTVDLSRFGRFPSVTYCTRGR